MMMMTVMDIAVCLTDVGLQLDHFQTAVVVKLTLYKEPIVWKLRKGQRGRCKFKADQAKTRHAPCRRQEWTYE